MIQIGGGYTTFGPREGILLQKYRDRNGRCIAILFKNIRVRGRCDSPEIPCIQVSQQKKHYRCGLQCPYLKRFGMLQAKAT